MKKFLQISLFMGVLLLSALLVSEIATAGQLKWVRVGNLWDKIIDSGDQGYGGGAYTFGAYYYNGFADAWQVWDYRRMALVCKNWTDADGAVHPYKMTGYAAWSNEQEQMIPVPDEKGVTIHRYMRYQPPQITVDGIPIEDPFPRQGDEVAPEKIPGTADMLIESTVRTSMGVTMHQKVLAWSQKNHDDYLIYDITLENTGNIDLDDEIELPDQVVDSLYFNRSAAWGWYGHMSSYYGAQQSDSLRLLYAYSTWAGGDQDNFGNGNKDQGFLEYPWWQGWAILHADESAANRVDDPSQPRMTGWYDSEAQFMRKPAYELNEQQQDQMWSMVTRGIKAVPGIVGDHPYLQDIGTDNLYPNTYHEVPMDVQAARINNPYAYSWDGGPGWITYIPIGIYTVGPYRLEPGQKVRIVWAHVMGSLSPQKGWEIGTQWKNGELTLDTAPDVELPPPAQVVYDQHPEYDENDQAKDKWVTTGRDSLFANATAAQWAVDHNYEVPVAPPPPSVEVNSWADGVQIKWGNESEAASDLAGYRVYRAVGSPYYTQDPVIVGQWYLVHVADVNEHEFTDNTAIRGFNYYYCVTAYDDGSHPEAPNYPGGVNGVAESLESGKWLNYTRTVPANLKRQPGEELKAIRIVPNPYNARSYQDDMHFKAERKIMFLNLPEECTIRIFTETGDLVKTIEHDDRSGDEAWVDPTGSRYMGTDSDQIPVSGIYIAHIETPEGDSINKLFVIVR